MAKKAQIELSLKWIIRIIFGLTFLLLFIDLIFKVQQAAQGMIPVLIIGLVVLGVTIEVIWKMSSGPV